MTSSKKIKLYFETGITISDEEQAEHDELVRLAQRESRRFMSLLIISVSKKLATLERNKDATST